MVFLLALVAGADAGAQQPRPTRTGDSAASAVIEAELRDLYQRFRIAAAALTRENVLALDGAVLTQVRSFSVDGRLARIVASATSPNASCGAEWYVSASESLLMTFESCEYPDGAASPSEWRNAFGLRGWERRVYFRDGAVVYEETSGTGAPDHRAGTALAESFARARAVLPGR